MSPGSSSGSEPGDEPGDEGAPDLAGMLDNLLGSGNDLGDILGASPDLTDLFGAGGGLGDLFRHAQQLGQMEVTGQSGGGAVRITMTGDFEVRSVQIEPAAVDPDDISMLEDLVLAALHDATGAARRLVMGAPGALGGPSGLDPEDPPEDPPASGEVGPS
ncbi:MAG TPA: YbaB/EbfC family nucleoid-associated protein [Acidimicrobiales bacterium]|nr:YbaB/EbfC family nucleoid-associated protein [Acidimicrobiales bacterium]